MHLRNKPSKIITIAIPARYKAVQETLLIMEIYIMWQCFFKEQIQAYRIKIIKSPVTRLVDFVRSLHNNKKY